MEKYDCSLKYLIDERAKYKAPYLNSEITEILY